jgi:phenylalanyl-tRNA synthetase beta chain
VVPPSVPLTEYNARHYYGEEIRRALAANGFSEVITSSFRKKDTIELQNALASDKGCMRSTLAKNITEVLDRNIPYAPLLVVPDIRVFEIGTVFHKTEDGSDITEHMSLAIGVRTKQQGYTPKDDAILKDVVTELEAALGISLTGTSAQGVYECNLSNLLAQLPPPTEYKKTIASERIFVPYSLYPFISRDVAVWVPDTVATEAVARIIRDTAGTLLVQLSLFDTFTKEGRVSYAFRIIFQSFEKTLTDEEINPIMDSVYEALKLQDFEIR